MNGPSSLQPVDWFSLAILFQIKAIHQNIQHSERNNQHNTNNYAILQSLLILATNLIFNSHQFQFNSIADIYHSIQQQLHQLPQLALHQIIRAINHSLQFAFDGSADGLYQFSLQLHTLVSPAPNSELDRPTDFHPDSPIGLYVRSCRLDISSLEFDQLTAIATQLKSFFNPQSRANTPPPSTSTIHHNYSNTDPTLEAYLDFTDSYAPDYNKASNSLRRFYDITSLNDHHHTKSSNQSGSNHQQALLSLSKFYLSVEAYPTALDALEEAARLARLASDRVTLDQCASLERRLVYFSGFEAITKIEGNGVINEEEEGGGGGLTGPVQAQLRLQSLRNLGHSSSSLDDEQHKNNANNNHGKNLHKSKLFFNGLSSNHNEWSFWDFNEEIFTVFKSLSIGADPINHLHARLFRANRMKIINNNSENDSSVNSETRGNIDTITPFDQISWFALQAKLWDLQGQTGLCEIYEDLALDCCEEKNEENFSLQDSFKLISKSDVLCQRASRLAKNGQFYEALLLICQLIIDNQCDAKSFRYIQQTVFEIFEFKAKHEGNEGLLASLKIFQSHSSTPPILKEKTKLVSVQKQIDHLFEQAESFMDQGNHHAALCPIVSAIVQSDKMNLKNLQSKGIILWADIILHVHAPSTEDITDMEDDDQAGNSHNRIMQRLAPILDLPGVQSNSFLMIQLLWIQVRLKIHQLFTHFFPFKFEDVSNQTLQILDLFSFIDILYQRLEDENGRKKVIGYELIVIEETKQRMKSFNPTKNEINAKEEEVEKFMCKLEELKSNFKEISSQLNQKKDHDHDNDNDEEENNNNNHLIDFTRLCYTPKNSSTYLFNLVQNLSTLSSIHRYL